MPHLLNIWPALLARFQSAGPILLLFDYDGTLTPIVSRPELAVLPETARQLLTRLQASPGFVIGFISGRSLADVRQRVNVPGAIYAGNHGLEMEGLGEPFFHPQAASLCPRLEEIFSRLGRELSGHQGVLVENKGLTLSVHYRLTPDEQVSQVEKAFHTLVSQDGGSGDFRVNHGKKVLELRPNVDWDKGKAIARIIQAQPSTALPVFFGDDATDEAGFQTVQEAGGIAVFVGPPRQPTQALHRVDSPAEVVQVLRLLLDL